MSQVKMHEVTLEKKPVKICGLKQNCYILDVNPDYVAPAAVTIKTYPSLERVNLPNGYFEEVVEKDYPITPESITSYADGADYKRDPLTAIENAPKRVNLGDISQAQEFINSDPLAAARQYKAILDKVDKYFKEQAVKQSQTKTETKTETKTNEGGVNNG